MFGFNTRLWKKMNKYGGKLVIPEFYQISKDSIRMTSLITISIEVNWEGENDRYFKLIFFNNE